MTYLMLASKGMRAGKIQKYLVNMYVSISKQGMNTQNCYSP